MKKIIATLLVLVLVLVLALGMVGCGNTASSTSSAASSASPSSDANSKSKPSDYPKKTIEVIVPYSTGGTHDLVARLVTPYFADLGYNLQVTNISGASGMTGTNEFLAKPADGYSILMMSPEVLAAQTAVGTTPDKVWQNLDYIGCWVRDPRTIAVDADSPYQTLDDLIKAGKENPDVLNWEANGSTGSGPLGAQMTWDAIGATYNYVPSGSVTDGIASLLGGHVDASQYLLSEVLSYHKAGELRILAIFSDERSELCPDVPTFKELGYNQAYDLTRCWAVKKGTPPEIVDTLSDVFYQVFQNENLQQELLKMGANPVYMSGDDLQAYGDQWYDTFTKLLAQSK